MKSMPLKQAEARLYSVAQGKANAKATVLTWKSDRSVEVERSGDTITLRETGFVDSEATFFQARDMKRSLKDACAREFPRSNRVHIEERML